MTSLVPLPSTWVGITLSVISGIGLILCVSMEQRLDDLTFKNLKGDSVNVSTP